MTHACWSSISLAECITTQGYYEALLCCLLPPHPTPFQSTRCCEPLRGAPAGNTLLQLLAFLRAERKHHAPPHHHHHPRGNVTQKDSAHCRFLVRSDTFLQMQQSSEREETHLAPSRPATCCTVASVPQGPIFCCDSIQFKKRPRACRATLTPGERGRWSVAEPFHWRRFGC